jgi:signal transduction histidine kinase/DNA-binding response OmpR family regulator
MVQYRYKLEGSRNDEWMILSQGNRNITFSNLRPGNYNLLINSTNSLGMWNNEYRMLELKVLPPSWKSVPAILAYILVFVLITFLSLRLWLIRQKEKNAIKIAQMENEQAEKLHNLKLQFFMNISHEFKTPLSLIVAPLGMLMNKFSGSEARHQLQLIYRNANRLLYLINQIIDFRKIEKEKLKLNYFSVNISQFAKNTLQLFTLTADEKNITLQVDSKDPEMMVQLDPRQIETVLYNLLSNALRYTPEEGKITILIQRHGDHCKIIVSDTGSGIAPSQVPHIFERFHFSPDPSGGKTGSGIGLSHTKSVVELHNGTIEVSSKKGKGTSFTITLPILALATTQQEITEIDIDEFFLQGHAVIQQEYSELEALKILDLREEEKPPMEEDIEMIQKKSASIVIAEDNDELRSYLLNLLSKRYEKVAAAADGKEALKLVRACKPDLLISDVVMSGMDGMELTRTIKEDQDLRKMFIILVTAKNFEEDRINAMQEGVDAYIFKPFNMQYLMLRIDKLFEQKDQVEKQYPGGMFAHQNNKKIANPDKLFIDRAIGMVEENLSNPDFMIESMYNELNVSRAQLYRKIKKLTGFSVKEFIREIRLYRAEQILREENLTVNEVSYKVGFGSPTYFSICFKRKYGVSPVQYKAKNYKKPRVSF